MTAIPKKLLVEGSTDQRVIPYLMEANGVEWPRGNEPVVIEAQGSISEILRPDMIETELRISGLEALGVIVDADDNAAARWRNVRSRCEGEFTTLPGDIPAYGLNVVHPDGPRFGVWIMPNNRFQGMLEDFLIGLVRPDAKPLYDLAQDCVERARLAGAPFKQPHRAKAEIHTWLAWQDEPGKQLHQAVQHRVLDPKALESQAFVAWFRSLFQV